MKCIVILILFMLSLVCLSIAKSEPGLNGTATGCGG